MPETETHTEVKYDPVLKRYRATVYDDAGATLYVSVRSTKASALWKASNFVAYQVKS